MSAVSKALYVADSGAGSKSGVFWPLKCLPGMFRKRLRGQADFNTNSMTLIRIWFQKQLFLY